MGRAIVLSGKRTEDRASSLVLDREWGHRHGPQRADDRHFWRVREIPELIDSDEGRAVVASNRLRGNGARRYNNPRSENDDAPRERQANYRGRALPECVTEVANSISRRKNTASHRPELLGPVVRD